ncbi:TPA: LysR family transcriptional regulator [Citrobacter freundii]
MDKLRSMEVFVAAVESGSFSAAALALGVTPQLIAKHIGNLEHRLGLRLLHRTTRRQSLTDFGQRYYEKCRHVLAEVEAADALACETLTEPRGKIRISAPYNFGSNALIPFLTEYLATWAETEIELSLSDRFVNVIEEGFDAVFRVGETSLQDSAALVCRSLKPFRLFACASPDYLRRNGTPQNPEELSQHECLGYVFWDRMTDKIWEFTKDNKTLKIPIKSRLIVNDTKAKVNAALQGFGITLCAEDMLLPYLKRGELVPLFEEYNAPSKPVSLIYPADRQQPARMRSFIAAAIKQLS